MSDLVKFDRSELQFLLRRPMPDGLRANLRALTTTFLKDVTSAPAAGKDQTDPSGTSVYFLLSQSTGLIKIGFSKNPKARMRLFQCGSGDRITLLASEPGAGVRERALHRQFRTARSHGEWFRPAPDLLAYIASLGGNR